MGEDTPYIDTPEHRSGYKIKNVVIDGEEWCQGIDQAGNAVFHVHKDHVDQFPNFWDDVACELKGGKGCHSHHKELAEILSHPACDETHEVQIKNIFKDIQRALTKADDKLDHKEDKALGIDK